MSIKDRAFAWDLSSGGVKISSDNGLACGGTDIGYTDTFFIENRNYALELQFASDGVVDVDVIVEQGNTELTTAEQASAHANFVVPYGKSAVTIEDELVNIIPLALTVTRLGRVRVTGSGSNDASTELVRCNLITI